MVFSQALCEVLGIQQHRAPHPARKGKIKRLRTSRVAISVLVNEPIVPSITDRTIIILSTVIYEVLFTYKHNYAKCCTKENAWRYKFQMERKTLGLHCCLSIYFISVTMKII